MISDEAVEAAAKTHFERSGSHWEDAEPKPKQEALDDMRAAFEAAAPHMLATPGTITNPEELDALPYGAVVIHDEGWGVTVAQRQAEDMQWYVTGCLEYIRPEALLPATVIPNPYRSQA